MSDRIARFVGLSSLLTGYTPFELRGTGMAAGHLATLDERLPPGLMDRLLAHGDASLLDDATLGPVARNIIVLWYCGSWPPLPAGWGMDLGPFNDDAHGVVSPQTYLAALQWDAAGAHPAGAQQQGYGAWATPPSAGGS